jgi:hypothetical protein
MYKRKYECSVKTGPVRLKIKKGGWGAHQLIEVFHQNIKIISEYEN